MLDDDRADAEAELTRLLGAIATEVKQAARARLYAPFDLPNQSRKAARLQRKNVRLYGSCMEFESEVNRVVCNPQRFAEFLEKQNNDDFFKAALDLIYTCRSIELLMFSYPREAMLRTVKLLARVEWPCKKCGGSGQYKLKDGKNRLKRCPDCEGTGRRALRNSMNEAVAFPVS